MKTKIKRILENELILFELISKDNDVYSIKAKIKNKVYGNITTDEILYINFDFKFDLISLLLKDNSNEYHSQTTFQELKNYLLAMFKTSELPEKTKLFIFLNNKIIELIRYSLPECFNNDSISITNIDDKYIEIKKL